MSKHKPAPPAPAPALRCEIRCRKCQAPVTVHLRLLDTVLARVVSNAEQLFQQGEAAFTHNAHALGDTADRYQLDHGVITNTADLVKTSCYPSSFGCCGYDAHQGPNLLCRNGHLIGRFVDECNGPHFAHLSLQHCEFFPLPPE
jgi:hypothetical protein